MTNEIAKFTLRTDSELMKKLRIVADYNKRRNLIPMFVTCSFYNVSVLICGSFKNTRLTPLVNNSSYREKPSSAFLDILENESNIIVSPV